MGTVFDGIDVTLTAWMQSQSVWFVATAPLAADGHVNVSPLGDGGVVVLDRHRVGWLDYTGSGIETIAHLRENGRVCLMFASFGPRPRIVRLHGHGTVTLPGGPGFDDVASQLQTHPSTRAAITVEVERVSDSCGHGVPVMDLVGDRDLLRLTADKKGPAGLAAYRAGTNVTSIDGLPGLPGS